MSALPDDVALGIISEPGLYPLPAGAEEVQVATPYGPTSAPIVLTTLADRRVALLSRTAAHPVPPAMIPARANLWALAKLGVRVLVSVSAAGGLRTEYAPGTYVVLDQLLDRTWGRPNTFYDEGRLVRLAAPEPFDPTLRALAAKALTSQGVPVRPTGTVMVIQGPRFDTRAESRWNAAAGADLVNMVLSPSVPLALELGMAVCGIALVTDSDATVEAGHRDLVSAALIDRRLHDASPIIRRAIWSMLVGLPEHFRAPSSIPPDAVAEVLARPVR